MIRSLIGIVCVLVMLTTCVQTTAAQPLGNLHENTPRLDAPRSTLRNWIELAEQGSWERIISSDAFHDDYRFRATPVKRSANWQMPIVQVRPAKQIRVRDQRLGSSNDYSRTSNALSSGTPAFTPKNGIELFYQALNTATTNYLRLRDRFEQITLSLIPRSILASQTPVAPGHNDYWDYYGDCDRWNVVFTIAWQEPPEKPAPSMQTAGAVSNRASFDHIAEQVWDTITSRWQVITTGYRRISQRFFTGFTRGVF